VTSRNISLTISEFRQITFIDIPVGCANEVTLKAKAQFTTIAKLGILTGIAYVA
jgi:hypothetical protein